MSTPLEALELARQARTDAQLDKWRADHATGGIYTVRARFNAGAYAYRTRHVEAGKPDTYGLILAREIGAQGVEYMTPVRITTKLTFDYAAELPVIEFDEDHCKITPEITDAEWAALTGQASA